MFFFSDFPSLNEFADFQKELKECFEKFRKATARRALDEASKNEADIDTILERTQSLRDLGYILTNCFEKTVDLVENSIDTWRKKSHIISLGDCSTTDFSALSESFPQFNFPSGAKPSSPLSSLSKMQEKPKFYRQMEGNEIKFLCFVGNNTHAGNSPGLYFNHKIPINQIELFVSFFIFCRDKGGSVQDQSGFVNFMKFSLVSDSLLKLSKQYPNFNSEKLRLNWAEKPDKKTSDKSFRIFKKPEYLCFLPFLYIYQSRDVLNFLLASGLVYSGTRGNYKASDNLSQVGLQAALNDLPVLLV